MSGTPAIPVATAPIALPLIVVGAAAAAIGVVCYGIGKGAKEGCKEVYKMCKEGKYPAELLQMVHTPVSNFDGLIEILKTEGFTTGPLSGTGISGMPGIEDHPTVAIATSQKGENIFLINSDSGISFISEHVDLVHSKIQDFVTHEIVETLNNGNFKVAVEEKGPEKVIIATDHQKNLFSISVKKGETDIVIDTRKTKRPKCDIIHQTIKAELYKTRRSDSNSAQQKRKREDRHIRIRG